MTLGSPPLKIGSTEDGTSLSDSFDIDISVPFCSNRQNRLFRPTEKAPGAQAFSRWKSARRDRRLLMGLQTPSVGLWTRFTRFIPIRPQSCTDVLFLKCQKLRLPRLRTAQKRGSDGSQLCINWPLHNPNAQKLESTPMRSQKPLP